MERSTVAAVVLAGLLVLAPGTGVVAANDDIEGHPVIGVSVPDNEVRPGEETSLNMVLVNDGNVTSGSLENPSLEDRVTTARALKVRIEDDHDLPISVQTNEQAVASLPDGQSAEAAFEISVADDAEPGTYDLPVNVTYNYTQGIDTGSADYNRTNESKTMDVEFVVEESPVFEVTDVDSNARVGATGTVAVTMENTGADAARNASVALESENGDLTFGQSATATRYVDGVWEPGENRTVEYRLTTADTANPRPYSFTSTVTYDNEQGNTREATPVTLGIAPQAEQQFAVVNASSAVAAGDTGDVDLTLRNEGPLTVRDASVTVSSDNGAIVFGESASTTQYVGEWAPNETRTVSVEATATGDAEARNYTLQASVDYEDTEGDSATSDPATFGLAVGPEQSFAADEFESTLRVGQEGTVSGTIENTAETPADSVVVVFDTENQNIDPLEREYSVGTMEPGETADFSFDVEVSDAAEAGPRQFSFHTEYRNQNGDRRESDSFDARLEVGEKQSVFDLTVENATVERGGSRVLDVTVTNAGDETLSDISAQVFADSPISVADDEDFVSELEPGESENLRFEISAAGTALEKTYPIEMDFQYDESDGDTKLSDTYNVPIEVVEPEDSGGLPTSVVLLVLVVLLAVGAIGYRRYA